MLTLLTIMLACGDKDQADDSATAGTCDISCQWSEANSGGLCQVNLFCDGSNPAMYCAEKGDGTYNCDCGAAAESPPSFVSEDMCDLEGEARVCAALEQCGSFWGL